MSSIKSFLKDIGQHYEIGEVVSADGFSLYPLLGADGTGVIGLGEAETLEVGWIEELEQEDVQRVQAINIGTQPFLIPYLTQIQGGRQDRIIFEPIIVPTGHDQHSPLTIPARCIEQSRWRYSSSRGETTTRRHHSTQTRMSSQMARSISAHADQHTVWENVRIARDIMPVARYDAPTQSYREMNEAVFDKQKDLGELKNKLLSAMDYPNQVGLVAVYQTKILGVELFGSHGLWEAFREEAINGFLVDRFFLGTDKDSKIYPPEAMLSVIEHELGSVEVKESEASGVGKLYRFGDVSWRGVTVFYDGTPVHFYAVKKHMDPVDGQGRGDQQMDFDPIERTQRRSRDNEREEISPTPSNL